MPINIFDYIQPTLMMTNTSPKLTSSVAMNLHVCDFTSSSSWLCLLPFPPFLLPPPPSPLFLLPLVLSSSAFGMEASVNRPLAAYKVLNGQVMTQKMQFIQLCAIIVTCSNTCFPLLVSNIQCTFNAFFKMAGLKCSQQIRRKLLVVDTLPNISKSGCKFPT